MRPQNDIGIRDGHPYTHWHCTSDTKLSIDDELLSDLPEEDQRLARVWVMAYMIPVETPNTHHTSYGLKHILQHDTGIYMTNNQFKDLMLQMGHEPVDEHELNWRFRISERAIKWAGDRVLCGKTIYDRPRDWMNPYAKTETHDEAEAYA